MSSTYAATTGSGYSGAPNVCTLPVGAHWYRNVLAGGAVEVQVGRLCFAPRVRVLSAEQAEAVLAEYEARHRLTARLLRPALSRLAAVRHDGADPARRERAARLPVVAFRPGVAQPRRPRGGA